MDTPDRIEVNASPLPTIVATTIRYGLQTVGGVLVARGFIDQPTADALVLQVGGVILTLAPSIWGIIRAKINHGKLVTTASAAPNSVAVVK